MCGPWVRSSSPDCIWCTAQSARFHGTSVAPTGARRYSPMKRLAMVSGFAAITAFVRDAAAQAVPPTAAPAPPAAATGDNSGILVALALMGVMLLIVGI